MNKNNESKQIHHDVKHCSAEELLTLYGIELVAEGAVFDHTTQKTYPSVDEWIRSSYNDDDVGFEKFSKFDEDDYYY